GAALALPAGLAVVAFSAAAAAASFAICLASRDLRRDALFGCRMPFAAARSSERTADTATARRSDAEPDAAPDASPSDFRALTTSVLTSDFTPRLRTVR